MRAKLLEEKAKLEAELGHLGIQDSQNPDNWMATEQEEGVIGESWREPEADPSDMADRIEDLEVRTAEERTLEVRLKEVRAALARMDDKTYGICSVSGTTHPIESERLEVNPAAVTCISHIEG